MVEKQNPELIIKLDFVKCLPYIIYDNDKIHAGESISPVREKRTVSQPLLNIC